MRQALKALEEMNIDSSLWEQAITEIEKLEEKEKQERVKFILILPTHVDKYIKWKSRQTNQHKAEVVRDAIYKKIKSDKEYASYNSI